VRCLVTSKSGPCIPVSRNPHFRREYEYKAGFYFVEMVKEKRRYRLYLCMGLGVLHILRQEEG
jgi:hypothetical protein